MERECTLLSQPSFVDETSTAGESLQEFNASELEEIKNMKKKSTLSKQMSFAKPSRKLTKTERKLKKEEAAQRKSVIETYQCCILSFFLSQDNNNDGCYSWMFCSLLVPFLHHVHYVSNK